MNQCDDKYNRVKSVMSNRKKIVVFSPTGMREGQTGERDRELLSGSPSEILAVCDKCLCMHAFLGCSEHLHF